MNIRILTEFQILLFLSPSIDTGTRNCYIGLNYVAVFLPLQRYDVDNKIIFDLYVFVQTGNIIFFQMFFFFESKKIFTQTKQF